MRRNRRANQPGARPSLLYTLPEMAGAEDHKVPVPQQELDICQTESTEKDEYPCERNVFDICCILMAENDWAAPQNGYEAAALYIKLKRQITADLA